MRCIWVWPPMHLRVLLVRWVRIQHALLWSSTCAMFRVGTDIFHFIAPFCSRRLSWSSHPPGESAGRYSAGGPLPLGVSVLLMQQLVWSVLQSVWGQSAHGGDLSLVADRPTEEVVQGHSSHSHTRSIPQGSLVGTDIHDFGEHGSQHVAGSRLWCRWYLCHSWRWYDMARAMAWTTSCYVLTLHLGRTPIPNLPPEK